MIGRAHNNWYETHATFRPDNHPIYTRISKRNTPVCKIDFGLYTVHAIVDTGADISAVSTACLRRIPAAHVDMFIGGHDRNVQSVTGSRLEVTGMAHLNFYLGTKRCKQAFITVKNLSKPLIIGSDFLGREKASIDLDLRLMHMGRQSIPLIRKSIPAEQCRVILKPGEIESIRQDDRLKVTPGGNLTIGGSAPDIGPASAAERLAMVNFLWERHGQFAASDLELGTTDLVEFDIEIQDSPPIRQRAYRVPWTQRSLLEQQINNMLEAGVVEPSTSPWSSPVLLVPKKDSTYRFCVDPKGDELPI